MKKIYIIYIIFFIVVILTSIWSFTYFVFTLTHPNNNPSSRMSNWEFRSIDTMKYSRDTSRKNLSNISYDSRIDRQVKQIADTGATHIAIDTPYDAEFLPFLKRWVQAARKYNLHVWFRGNWSGWEGWFDYPKIARAEHIQKTSQFIRDNSNLFKNGDVFTPCPECENGGPGDPRENGDIAGHRQFLIDEYKATKEAFKQQGLDVKSNYNSMNYDVAQLVMDQKTTQEMDNLIVVDHYVSTPDKLSQDIASLIKKTGAKVILGEFGVPIPDINGEMTEEEQANWIHEAIRELAQVNNFVGLNYWTSVGGSTALWDEAGVPRKAVAEF